MINKGVLAITVWHERAVHESSAKERQFGKVAGTFDTVSQTQVLLNSDEQARPYFKSHK